MAAARSRSPTASSPSPLCSVSDFNLQVGSGSTVTYGVGVTISTSAENCAFSNIRAQPGSGTLTNAFAVSPDARQDVEFTNFWNCTGTGCANAWWIINDGTPANVLDTHIFGCTSNNNQYGVYAHGAGFCWYGGDFGENTYADIYLAGMNESDPVVVEGPRSENSARLLYATNVGDPATVAIRDYYFGVSAVTKAALPSSITVSSNTLTGALVLWAGLGS